jgi:hypothetical protein
MEGHWRVLGGEGYWRLDAKGQDLLWIKNAWMAVRDKRS